MTWDSIISMATGIFSIFLACRAMQQSSDAETRMNNTFNAIQAQLSKLSGIIGKVDQGVNSTLKKQTILIGQLSTERERTTQMFFENNRKGSDAHEK